MWIKVSPVHINKWHFYMNKFNKICESESKICNDDALSFNWFSIGTVYIDKFGIQVLQLDRYTSFFDKKSGKTYHITFDSTEFKPCTLKIIDPISLSKKEYNLAIKNGYDGITMHYNKDKSCDLICDEVNMYFNQNVLEESKLCPYINYAKSHSYILRQEYENLGFPSDEELNNSSPGKLSIKLRKILCEYFF